MLKLNTEMMKVSSALIGDSSFILLAISLAGDLEVDDNEQCCNENVQLTFSPQICLIFHISQS